MIFWRVAACRRARRVRDAYRTTVHSTELLQTVIACGHTVHSRVHQHASAIHSADRRGRAMTKVDISWPPLRVASRYRWLWIRSGWASGVYAAVRTCSFDSRDVEAPCMGAAGRAALAAPPARLGRATWALSRRARGLQTPAARRRWVDVVCKHRAEGRAGAAPGLAHQRSRRSVS